MTGVTITNPGAIMANLFDKSGREIIVGDVLKVYHFTAALRRKKHYMYKQVTGTRAFRDGTVVLDVSHLDLTADTYPLICDGSTLLDYEIVQDVAAKLYERPRKSVTRDTTGGDHG